MNSLKWEVVRHVELSDKTKISIAELKNQHWPYGIESQIEWMNKNIQNDDYHLLGFENSGMLRAYLTIVQLNVRYDGKEKSVFGIGGVCVDRSIIHSGLGKKLVLVANSYIQKEAKIGLLLCKEMLTDFYKKCDWINVDYEKACVAGRSFENIVMSYPHEFKCESISIDRNF